MENLLLRHQLAVLTRPTCRHRARFRRLDKLLWVLVRRRHRDWRRPLVVVTPDPVIRGHRAGWRLSWRWRSCASGGRPRRSPEIRDLITRMSHENPLWGAERIRGELRTLGIEVSTHSIRRSRWRGPQRPPSQTWRTFLANPAHAIWVADLLTVPTLTFRTLYVLCFIGHGRRQLLHFHVTAHPTAAWIWQPVVNATPWRRAPEDLLRDRDRVYGSDFGATLKGLGIEQVLTPVWAPRANAVAERLVGTFRREGLDHVIVVNEPHLYAVLAEFLAYYNGQRPHRSLVLEPPLPLARAPTGRIRSRPVLGGLHHVYERAA